MFRCSRAGSFAQSVLPAAAAASIGIYVTGVLRRAHESDERARALDAACCGPLAIAQYANGSSTLLGRIDHESHLSRLRARKHLAAKTRVELAARDTDRRAAEVAATDPERHAARLARRGRARGRRRKRFCRLLGRRRRFGLGRRFMRTVGRRARARRKRSRRHGERDPKRQANRPRAVDRCLHRARVPKTKGPAIAPNQVEGSAPWSRSSSGP
jgi:hypothetical protein